MKIFVSSLFLLFILALQGCATLNKSECRKADWNIIGLEDGSAGRPVSYIGRHRKACAEHGVKPNLSQYQHGHAEGVILFCTPRKAFELGNSGRGHQDICPAGLRGTFLAAYDDGREVYTARQELNQAKNRIRSAQTDLEQVVSRLASLEAHLVSSNGTAEQRQSWLNEVKLLQLEQRQLESDIHALEHEISERQSEYEFISSQFRY